MSESCTVPLDAALLRTDFVPNKSEVVPIRAAITAQRKTISDIEQQIRELDRQREVAQDALAVNEAFLAPVRRLAPEILGKIFEHCLSQELQRTSYMDAPLVLMCVSRRWRTVARETPRLWMQVLVDYRTPKPYAEMWIKNSGSLPLSVVLHLEYIGHEAAADSDTDDISLFPIPEENLEVIQMFIEHLARIRIFELHCSYSVLRKIFLTGMRKNMASIEELTVSCSNFPGISRLDPSHDVYHVETTRLHTLVLDHDLFFIISIKPSNLRVLKLLGHHPMSALFKFLRLCPGLEELIGMQAMFYARSDESDDELNLEAGPIVLASLWKLEIEWQVQCGTGRFLRSLHTPVVRSAVLRNFSGEMDELYHFFTTCASSLHHLTLENLSCNPYQFYLLMKDLTELETLSLESLEDMCGIWEPFTPQENSPPNLWLCPNLHSLECSGFGRRRNSQFVGFVRRRIAPIPQAGLGGIPHINAFNYLTNIVFDSVETFYELQALQSLRPGLVLRCPYLEG